MKIEIYIPDDELRQCVSCGNGEMTLTLSINETLQGYDVTSVVSDTYCGNTSLKYRTVDDNALCRAEDSGWADIRACDDCPHKCEEWHQWEKGGDDVT